LWVLYIAPMNQQALLIFVKNPIAGKTKTRLAATVGDEKALKMYHQLMTWTRDQAVPLEEVDRYLFYSNWVEEEDGWPQAYFQKLVQKGPGLGERMQHGFEHAFQRGHQSVIIIGSDCPGVTTELLTEAYRKLQSNDVVIGPALDGGYYLLGLRQMEPSLFQDMAWSTESVLPDTIQRAQAAGLSVAQLTPLSDVDYLEDWLYYGWMVPE
jgi:rSAM/selenodomain-associated transferase 1